MRKFFVAALVLGATTFHLSMTGIFLAPKSLLTQKLAPLAERYMFPVFFQDWHLFSPNPGFRTTKLLVRCSSESAWMDPLSHLQALHTRNRISGHGKIWHLYLKLADKTMDDYAKRSASCQKTKSCDDDALLRETQQQTSFQFLERIGQETCAGKTSFQMKTVRFTPKKFSEKDTEKKWGLVEEIEYPARTITRLGDSK